MDRQGWVRASDAEREATVARLNAATVEGRLSLEEFDDRARLAHAARTHDELASLTADLPVATSVDSSPMAGPRNALPVWSLTMGILALPMAFCIPFGLPFGVAGIVLGIVGLRRARRGLAGLPGMALAGLICGSVGLAFGLALFAVVGGPTVTVK